jgi:hypothetical protein
VTDIKPGLYDGLDEAEYHGHKGSVSVSGAKKLLPPSCPAIFKHERDQGQQQRDVFDFGKAAHKEALGVGPELVVVDADNWMTKAAKEAKAAAYADGSVPNSRGSSPTSPTVCCGGSVWTGCPTPTVAG